MSMPLFPHQHNRHLREKLEAIWQTPGCLCPANSVRWSTRQIGWAIVHGLWFAKGRRYRRLIRRAK